MLLGARRRRARGGPCAAAAARLGLLERGDPRRSRASAPRPPDVRLADRRQALGARDGETSRRVPGRPGTVPPCAPAGARVLRELRPERPVVVRGGAIPRGDGGGSRPGDAHPPLSFSISRRSFLVGLPLP